MLESNAANLSVNRLYETIRENRSELYRVHQDLQELWNVSTKFPKLIVHDTYSKFDVPDKVFLGVNSLLEEKKALEKIGYEIPIESLMKIVFSEEYTHYVINRQNPENDAREEEFLFGGLLMKDYDSFLKAASMRTQNEGIANIGKKKIADGLNLGNFIEVEREHTKNLFKLNNKIFEENVFGEPMEHILSEYDKGGENAQKAHVTFVNYILDAFSFTSSGSGLFIADEIENKNEGRLSQLIRKKIEPEKRYSEHYLGFVREYMPSFGDFLEELEQC